MLKTSRIFEQKIPQGEHELQRTFSGKQPDAILTTDHIYEIEKR